MSLASLCGICGRKGPDLRTITATIQDRIRSFTPLKKFSLDTGFYPTKVCSSCRLTLSEFNKVSKSERRKVFLNLCCNFIQENFIFYKLCHIHVISRLKSNK